jgi:two-component system OmpR family response regulator
MKYLPHIVVVDDSPDVCDVVRHLLEGNGFRVSIADSGPAMRAIVDQHLVDLVVIDAALPGESGLLLAEHAAERGLPVIMMTGHPNLRQSLADSGLPYILKPFHIADMLRLVNETLHPAAS